MEMKKKYGRLMSALTMIVTMVVLLVSIAAVPMTAAAATVSKSFTTHSQASSPLLVFGGETFTFAVSGSFIGSVKLQKSHNGADYKDLTPTISTGAAYSNTLYAEAPLGRLVYYRVYASTHTSGTIVTSLADVNDSVQTFKNYKGVDVVEIKDDGLTGASIADAGIVTAKLGDASVVTAKLALQSVITAKIYLDVPALKVACITTAKTLGACTNLTAATGVCNSCN